MSKDNNFGSRSNLPDQSVLISGSDNRSRSDLPNQSVHIIDSDIDTGAVFGRSDHEKISVPFPCSDHTYVLCTPIPTSDRVSVEGVIIQNSFTTTPDNVNRINREIHDYGEVDLPEGSLELLTDYFGDVEQEEQEDDDNYPNHHELQVELDDRPILNDVQNTPDMTEDGVRIDFEGRECGCQKHCFQAFEGAIIKKSHMDCAEMNEYCNYHLNHQNLLLLGALNCLTRTSSSTESSGKKPGDRKQTQTEFMFRGKSVCRQFFQYVFGTGVKRLKNVKNTFISAGLVGNQHKNVTKASIIRSMPFDVRMSVVTFVNNFANQHVLVLPGRVPSFRNLDLKILPCSMNKTFLYKKYEQASETNGTQTISLRSWYNVWNSLCSSIVIQKPRTDLCNQCQQNVTTLSRMAGLSEKEKQEKLEKSLKHLTIVQREREAYKKSIADCKLIVETELPFEPSKNAPCSFKGTMHYSFDYAQQVHLQFSSQQVGPLYFLTGYKVGLFGVSLEPIGKFILYIIPESCVTGKGSNTVVSLLHHFFKNFGLGEEVVFCHADNCSGQNKNNYLMQYGIWRTLTGLHKEFHVSCLPVGHTKFTPDLFFGLFENLFRRSEVNCLADLTRVASDACPKARSIIPCFVGNEEGAVFIKTYDWQSLFSTFKCATIPNLLQYQHFDVRLIR